MTALNDTSEPWSKTITTSTDAPSTDGPQDLNWERTDPNEGPDAPYDQTVDERGGAIVPCPVQTYEGLQRQIDTLKARLTVQGKMLVHMRQELTELRELLRKASGAVP